MQGKVPTRDTEITLQLPYTLPTVNLMCEMNKILPHHATPTLKQYQILKSWVTSKVCQLF